MNINFNTNHQNASFKGIIKYAIKHADIEKANGKLIDSSIQAGKEFTAFYENAKYPYLAEKIEQCGDKLTWILNNLSNKNIQLKVPEVFTRDNAYLYIFDGKDHKEITHFYKMKAIKKPITYITKFIEGIKLAKLGIQDNDAHELCSLLKASEEGDKELKQFLKGKKVKTIEWTPKD